MPLKLRHGFQILICAAVLATSPGHAADGALEVPIKETDADGAPIKKKLKLYSASKALVIGIDDYKRADGSGWPKLSKAVEDAEAVAKALEARGFTVTRAKDLSSVELDGTFRQFFIGEGADPDARLLIWFAGHGHTILGEGYLVPADAPDPRVNDVDFRSKALSLRRFGEYMREARAKHVLAVFDSCFGGSVFNVARARPPRAITLATTQTVRQFISSGDADQVVSDNGAFRRLFVDAIEGREPNADANGDGFITGTELGLFVSDKVTNYSEKGQTPRYGKLNAQGYDRGDFVLERGQLAFSSVGQPPIARPVATAAPATTSEVERAWELIKDSKGISVIEAFRKQYGSVNALYDQLAATRIAALHAEEKSKARERAETAAANEQGKLAMLAPTELPSCSGIEVDIAGIGKRCKKPGEVFRDCPDCPEMVVVPAGDFTMGANKTKYTNPASPPRTVTISKPFAMGVYEVTWNEWTVCSDKGGCASKFEDYGWGKGRRPVVGITWSDAKAYVAWLSEMSGKKYGLPSEAAWEYSAKAGTTTDYSFGNSLNSKQARISTGEKGGSTIEVGSYPANDFGLHDMHGNVFEWVEDCVNENFQNAPSDGSAWLTGDCDQRVIRGGCWGANARMSSSTYRFWYRASKGDEFTGFRVVRSLDP